MLGRTKSVQHSVHKSPNSEHPSPLSPSVCGMELVLGTIVFFFLDAVELELWGRLKEEERDHDPTISSMLNSSKEPTVNQGQEQFGEVSPYSFNESNLVQKKAKTGLGIVATDERNNNLTGWAVMENKFGVHAVEEAIKKSVEVGLGKIVTSSSCKRQVDKLK
ncbi:hypothetical protein ACH5RR_009260 [Cinchona calisaya]|uniref:RNase H type-1 domain-containing protein n=1 Tax=Cinchona calisaya TaxID=153742 RepID=A0ABD3AIA1_9GENT